MGGLVGQLRLGMRHVLGSMVTPEYERMLVSSTVIKNLHNAYMAEMALGVVPPTFSLSTGAPTNASARSMFVGLARRVSVPVSFARAFVVALYGRATIGKIARKWYDPVGQKQIEEEAGTVRPTTFVDTLKKVGGKLGFVYTMLPIAAVAIGGGYLLSQIKR